MDSNIPCTVQLGNSPTYKIRAKLGEGGYGEVFLGHIMTDASNSTMHGPEEVAIKFENVYQKGKKCQPPEEWTAYDQLGGCPGIPRIYYKGCYGQFYVMIMELLGISLSNLCTSQGSLLLHSDVNTIATQALSILETIHKKGFVHGDIKPGNILFGRAGSVNENKIYIADLGFAMTWRDRFTGEQMLDNPTRGFVRGTLRYASLYSHLKMRPSRADDLESLAYTLIYLVKLSLPWIKFEEESNAEQLIYSSKAEISPAMLCSLCPPVLKEFLSMVKKIRYGAEPDYRKLISLFDGTTKGRKHTRNNQSDDCKRTTKRGKT